MTRNGQILRALGAIFGLAALLASFAIPAAQAVPAAPAVPSAPAAPAAPALPAPLQAAGPFTAQADASLLTVDVPALAGTPDALLPQTNVELAHSSADAASAEDLDADKDGAQRTAAAGETSGSTTLLDSPVELPFAFASAPESMVDDPEPTIPIPADPLLNLAVIDAYAEANWVSDTECVSSDDPLSLATQSVADGTVLSPDETFTLLDLEGEEGVAESGASTAMPATGGANDERAITASAFTTLAGADLLVVDGEPVLDVQVVQSPNYTASATGLPGGASVTGDDPVVDVSIGGQDAIRIEAGQIEEEPAIGLTLADLFDGLDPLLAELAPVVRLSIPVSTNVAADGTAASVDASLLRVELLPPSTEGLTEPVAALLAELLAALGLDVTAPLAVVDLGPISVAVRAPAGGITCGGPEPENPLELQKVHSGPAIPGSSFDYTIAVGNISDIVGEPCTMDPVRVVDLLTGPAGSTIESTEPAATVTPVDGGFQIVWDNVGPIEPGGRVTLRIRVNVPANATVGSNYNDHVETTATCDGRDVTRVVDLPEPHVEAPPSGPCNVDGSTKSKSHLEVYPGETFDYFVNVYNSGGEACTGVTVTDPIDPRLTFDACSDDCTVDGNNITWTIGTLAPGQSLTLWVQVTVNADATGELTNTAVIDTNETGPKTVTVQGPLITDTSVLASGNPARTPTIRLARTGGAGLVGLAAALGLLALAFANLRRRLLPT